MYYIFFVFVFVVFGSIFWVIWTTPTAFHFNFNLNSNINKFTLLLSTLTYACGPNSLPQAAFVLNLAHLNWKLTHCYTRTHTHRHWRMYLIQHLLIVALKSMILFYLYICICWYFFNRFPALLFLLLMTLASNSIAVCFGFGFCCCFFFQFALFKHMVFFCIYVCIYSVLKRQAKRVIQI